MRPKYGPGDLLTVRRGSWTFLLLPVHPSGDIHPIDQVERLEEGETVLVLASRFTNHVVLWAGGLWVWEGDFDDVDTNMDKVV